MDITVLFPKHKIGVDGILAVVDRLTKFAMFLPCRYHAKAPESVEVLYADWIRTKGYPKEIVCDRDTRFMFDFWLALIKRWGSFLKPSSVRHPQIDGQTERAHHTAQVLLRTLIRPDQKHWVERLPDVELDYNSSIHPAIGMSPFEFEHGSPVTSSLDTIIPRTAGSGDHLLFLSRMQKLLLKAHDQMAKTQQRMSQQANRQHLLCPFRAGDLVSVSAAEFNLEQDISRKLLPKWMGPWPVVAPAGDAPGGPSFTIQVPARLPVYPLFHCSKLALYTPAEHDDFLARRSQDPSSMDSFQEVGDIISQRRYSNRPTEYLVHFAHCTHKVDHWLTHAELQATTPNVLACYERKMQGKPVSSAPRGEIRTCGQVENRRQQMLARLRQLRTELHGASPDAEQHVRSQFDLRAAESELEQAETAVHMLEVSSRVQQIIDRGRITLDQYVAEQLAKIAGDMPKEEERGERSEKKEEPELSEKIMEGNIKRLEDALNAERKKMEDYQRKKKEKEQHERKVGEIRQRFHFDGTETDPASVLNTMMAYLAHLEMKIDNNTVELQTMTRLVKIKKKVVIEEGGKGKEEKESQEKLMKDAMKIKQVTSETPETSKKQSEEPAKEPTKTELAKEAEKPKKKEKVKMKLSFTYNNKKGENLLL
ncbi:hypothetical protein CBR_g32436 [Chara braunii]|uniref:Integrase catalytic domain-containing protein n=1 Tax=Chara braunii TaxID=69332 RepID=A0A388JYS0_CHABU|nr:hypothetical protein CBR_g32436 [Chara braunii]|eukprot:GBG62853.1 hypothetical protein CBR_g32436 [Chara braunii]